MTMFRPIAGALAALLVCGGLSAQDDEQQALIQKRDEKLESAFLKNADWILSYEDAMAKAKETGKPIFAYFTRSYSP